MMSTIPAGTLGAGTLAGAAIADGHDTGTRRRNRRKGRRISPPKLDTTPRLDTAQFRSRRVVSPPIA